MGSRETGHQTDSLTSNPESIKPPRDLSLPKITTEIWERYQDEEFIEDSPRWGWTQAAVDFACEIVRPTVWAEIERLREELKMARFAPMGDNHHNAMAWPYCNPERPAVETFAGRGPDDSEFGTAEWRRDNETFDVRAENAKLCETDGHAWPRQATFRCFRCGEERLSVGKEVSR